jgi:ABC-type glutathione transport system ATPase component
MSLCHSCSGAGKTTFVDVLAGRTDYSGSYTMNGQDVTAEMIRKKSAYVQQEDMFFPYLTVREHLWFQAQLRLPSTMAQDEKDGGVFSHIRAVSLAASPQSFNRMWLLRYVFSPCHGAHHQAWLEQSGVDANWVHVCNKWPPVSSCGCTCLSHFKYQ